MFEEMELYIRLHLNMLSEVENSFTSHSFFFPSNFLLHFPNQH